MDEGSGVAEGGRGDRGGVDNGRPLSRLPGRLPFIKGASSACLPQTPTGGAGCQNCGNRGGWRLRTSVALAPCLEARRRWTCLLGTAPWTRTGTPTTGLYSPGAPTSCDLLGSSVISFRDCPSCGVPAPIPAPGSASCLRLAVG